MSGCEMEETEGDEEREHDQVDERKFHLGGWLFSLAQDEREVVRIVFNCDREDAKE
jgi:hypothetical protein